MAATYVAAMLNTLEMVLLVLVSSQQFTMIPDIDTVNGACDHYLFLCVIIWLGTRLCITQPRMFILVVE